MDNLNNSAHILKENHSPSFFQNTCTGHNSEKEGRVGEWPEKIDGVDHVDTRPSPYHHDPTGWLKTLKYLPKLTDEILDNHLIKGSSTVPIVSIELKAFRKQGYRLWKEGCVRNIFVKPNVAAKCKLFLVNSKYMHR